MNSKSWTSKHFDGVIRIAGRSISPAVQYPTNYTSILRRSLQPLNLKTM